MKEPLIDLSKKELENSKLVLRAVLANTYVLHLKTRIFQWNIDGEDSLEYRQLFEEEYQQLLKNIDRVATRLRILGLYVPNNTAEMMHMSEIAEEGNLLRPRNMIEVLLADHETLIRSIRDGLRQLSSSTSFDDGTKLILKEILINHEKTAWKLRCLLS